MWWVSGLKITFHIRQFGVQPSAASIATVVGAETAEEFLPGQEKATLQSWAAQWCKSHTLQGSERESTRKKWKNPGRINQEEWTKILQGILSTERESTTKNQPKRNDQQESTNKNPQLSTFAINHNIKHQLGLVFGHFSVMQSNCRDEKCRCSSWTDWNIDEICMHVRGFPIGNTAFAFGPQHTVSWRSTRNNSTVKDSVPEHLFIPSLLSHAFDLVRLEKPREVWHNIRWNWRLQVLASVLFCPSPLVSIILQPQKQLSGNSALSSSCTDTNKQVPE